VKRNYSVLIALLVLGIVLLIALPRTDIYEESQENFWNSTPVIELHHYPGHLENESNVFWFVHITDVHINSFEKIFGVQSDLLRQLLNNIKNYINPSFIIETGDLVNGLNPLPYYQDLNQWKIRWSVLQETGMNDTYYYDLVGNHDGYGNSDTFSYFLNWSIQKKLQYTFNRSLGLSNYSFIVLNSVWSNGAEWPDGTSGELNTSELDWFESQLIKNKNSNLTFVFQHHPYTEVGNYTTSSGKTFLELLKEFNVSADIFGHGHENLERNQGGTICIETGSLGQGDQSFRIFAVDNDGISSKVGILNHWPIAMITTPMDRNLSRTAYDIPNTTKVVPVRALVFDRINVDKVQFNIDNSNWSDMTNDSTNKYLWNGSFDATLFSNGVHTINLRAISNSGISTDSISIYIGNCESPEIINKKIKNINRYSNAGPLLYNISNHKWDKEDTSDKLKWNLSNIDPSFCNVQIIDNDSLLFTPVPGSSGTKTITISLIDSTGKSISQDIQITLYLRIDTDQLITILIIIEIMALSTSIILGIFWHKIINSRLFKSFKSNTKS